MKYTVYYLVYCTLQCIVQCTLELGLTCKGGRKDDICEKKANYFEVCMIYDVQYNVDYK